MKTLLLGVVAFAAAAAGGTWYAVRNAPPPELPAAVDSAVTVADAPKTGGDHGTGAKPISTTIAVDTTPVPVSVPVPAPKPVPTAGPTPEERQAAQRVTARIFAQMKADEAASVLKHMSDDEIEAVMRNLGTRQAAALLSSLPEQRAARLARRLMIPRGPSR